MKDMPKDDSNDESDDSNDETPRDGGGIVEKEEAVA